MNTPSPFTHQQAFHFLVSPLTHLMAARVWSLFLVAMLCCEAVYVEGRRLKGEEEDAHIPTNSTYPTGGGNGSSRTSGWSDEVEHAYEYRSTDPGHSPGVGHSDKN
ncbi:hypothetical protein MLD38_030905 [Melastoma candidum]|uniref:Uncharacterized protein n=1 Tax=Melastoma candidum TaxID=119954 RepID=A0ACB9MPM9_9MYRT|nr:hypothetical protein MLD38_030905 [Melastoma candidum]